MLFENLQIIKNRLIELNRTNVRIIAVSKTHGPEKIIELYNSGQIDFGENRFSEARDKISLLEFNTQPIEKQPIFHHIGPLMSGNARQVANLFHYVHGVSSTEQIEILAKTAAKRFGSTPSNTISDSEHFKLHFLIQVRLTDEKTKAGGMSPEKLKNLSTIFENNFCVFSGLMTMGPENMEKNETREVFHRLREIRDELFPGKELSMGMSSDWEIAVEEGSTMIRLGTTIFGKRNEFPWKLR